MRGSFEISFLRRGEMGFFFFEDVEIFLWGGGGNFLCHYFRSLIIMVVDSN